MCVALDFEVTNRKGTLGTTPVSYKKVVRVIPHFNLIALQKADAVGRYESDDWEMILSAILKPLSRSMARFCGATLPDTAVTSSKK